jgi:hypothetical protein
MLRRRPLKQRMMGSDVPIVLAMPRGSGVEKVAGWLR